jgi:hypothetical protein
VQQRKLERRNLCCASEFHLLESELAFAITDQYSDEKVLSFS